MKLPLANGRLFFFHSLTLSLFIITVIIATTSGRNFGFGNLRINFGGLGRRSAGFYGYNNYNAGSWRNQQQGFRNDRQQFRQQREQNRQQREQDRQEREQNRQQREQDRQQREQNRQQREQNRQQREQDRQQREQNRQNRQ